MHISFSTDGRFRLFFWNIIFNYFFEGERCPISDCDRWRLKWGNSKVASCKCGDGVYKPEEEGT
jgi:hypothetical protein